MVIPQVENIKQILRKRVQLGFRGQSRIVVFGVRGCGPIESYIVWSEAAISHFAKVVTAVTKI